MNGAGCVSDRRIVLPIHGTLEVAINERPGFPNSGFVGTRADAMSAGWVFETGEYSGLETAMHASDLSA